MIQRFKVVRIRKDELREDFTFQHNNLQDYKFLCRLDDEFETHHHEFGISKEEFYQFLFEWTYPDGKQPPEVL